MNRHLIFAASLANLLDNQFGFGKYKFGLSAIIDLIPGVGDIIDAAISFYLVWIAINMKVPGLIIFHMVWNILVNFIIGLIPILGDAAYIFRRVNLKNLKLLQDYANKHNFIEGEIIG